jgi:glycosyltransferase involved in cell wall biosynthesis
MKVSIVCPIKDEVNLITRTLPSFYSVDPDEVILCLDKPAPRNVTLAIESIAERLGKSEITRILEVERNPSYRFHQAWVRRSGFRAARNDAILTSDIDIVLDPRMKEYFQLLRGDVKLVSFAKFAKAWHILMAYLIQKFRKKSFTGLYLFSKVAWLSTEDEASLKTISRGEDTHLYNAMVKKRRVNFVRNVKNVLLRPKEGKKYKFQMGWYRAKSPMWEVAMSSLAYFRPYMLLGYLDARLRHFRLT